MEIALNHSFGLSPMVQLYWDNANNRPAANNPWFNPVTKHAFNVVENNPILQASGLSGNCYLLYRSGNNLWNNRILTRQIARSFLGREW